MKEGVTTRGGAGNLISNEHSKSKKKRCGGLYATNTLTHENSTGLVFGGDGCDI